MSQSQLDALRIVAQQKKAVADAREAEYREARQSLEATRREASTLVAPFVKESIEAYNEQLGERRIDTECGMYAHVDLDSMCVSVTFDIFYPPMKERANKQVKSMTLGEDDQVANFLSKDLVQRLAKAGYELGIGKIGYDWNL